MKIEEEIKEYFKDQLRSPSTFYKAIKLAPKEILDYCESILQANSNWQKISFVILGIIRGEGLPICHNCGKQMTWSQSHKRFCSNHCAQSSKEILDKICKTNMKRYGTKSPLQNNEVKEKRNKNNLQKYGVKQPISLNKFKKKREETCLQKYGTKSPAQNQNVKQKSKQTCLQRYGVQYTGQIPEKIEKTKATNLERYGVQVISKSQKIKQIARINCLERYGVDNPAKLQLFKQTAYNRGWQFIKTFQQYVQPMFTREQYHGGSYQYQWKCKKCGTIFKQNLHSTSCFCQNQYIPRCLNCYPKSDTFYRSAKQIQVANFCKQYFPNLDTNNRQLINPYQLDIVIKDIRLAIEFNGTYWHSAQCGKGRDYHLLKTVMCQAQGYRLIQIMQSEFDLNRDQIFDKLGKILEGRQVLPKLDRYNRFWYSTHQFNKCKFLPPQEMMVDRYTLFNSGYIQAL